MGTRPYWVLETGKGKIEIKLDPFTAPATVSAIDSPTRSGAYDDIPFHRGEFTASATIPKTNLFFYESSPSVIFIVRI